MSETKTKITGAKLHKLSYWDDKAETHIEVYSDTVILESHENSVYLVGVRFGGYPERVKAMEASIYGGGTITLHMSENDFAIKCYTKRYTRNHSHEGVYAESTMLVRDEEESTGQDDGENISRPRKVYLYCEADDDGSHLYEILDTKTAVPLIPEFKDYVLSELKKRGILRPCQLVSCAETFECWSLTLSSDEKNIVAVIEDGLREGAISIPGAEDTSFPNVRSVTQYLAEFGTQIGERIRRQFSELFNPADELLSPEILRINEFIVENCNYSLYDAQLAVCESMKRRLQNGKFSLCVGEPGSGKTKLGSTALSAYQQRNGGKHIKCFNVVMCPSHLTVKWMREIEESIPETWAAIVTNITELNRVYNAYLQDDKSCYVIMSKEKARDGYMNRPAVSWNERKRAFLCPNCSVIIEMDLIEDGTKYKIPADGLFFRRENAKNRKCEHCENIHWTALSPEYGQDRDNRGEWVKVSDFGFVHRKLAWQLLPGLEKSPVMYDLVKAVVDNPSGKFPNTGAYKRAALSTYIKNKMRGKIDGLIVDELHQYSNKSGQGDAMAELFQVAKKVIGLTGTLINGYSSGLFHLLYRVAPDLMLKDEKRYENPLDFNAEYGVTESVYELATPDYNSNRRSVKRKIKERQLPGVSPLVYSRFLLDSAVFLGLHDVGKDLPEYEEIPIQLEMKSHVADAYSFLENEFRYIMRNKREIAKKLLATMLGLLTVYPDQPYNQPIVVHPITGDDLIIPEDTSDSDELHEKDHHVLEIVKRKISEGSRVLIYTSWIRIDTQQKLYKLLTEEGYRVAILTSAVIPNKREAWVESQVENGIEVLITNPALVETGLDLNEFTTLVYYNVSYNLFTLRQSSRRSWRINQKAPRVEVYFMFYEGTMQHRAITLMASKLAVAGILEGTLSDEGLAAMSEAQDMTSILARELTLGIKNEGSVEDLASIFKKMALLKPEEAKKLAIAMGLPEDFDPFADGFDPFAVTDVVEGTYTMKDVA